MAKRFDRNLSIFAPMIKPVFYIFFCVLSGLIVSTTVKSQNLITPLPSDSSLNSNPLTPKDSLGAQKDSMLSELVVNDSLIVRQDSIKKSKWDFLTGGNDSTYYSFYGHRLNINDSIIVKKYVYHLQSHDLETSTYDSSLYDFHQHHPGFKNSINNSFLGNTGLALKSNIFFDPQPATDFYFMQSFSAYTFQNQTAEYYNVAKPFTKFTVNIAPKDEQDIDILHTQNVNRFFNITAHFKNFTGEGFYLNQETRNNAGVLSASYTQGRIATHFNYNFNKIDVTENGGITDLFYSTLPEKEISTRLAGGANYLKDRQLFFDQKVGFMKTHVPDSAKMGEFWFSLQYTYIQQKSAKIYVDESHDYTDSEQITHYLYSNTYNGTSSYDTSSFKSRRQNFRLNLEENPRNYPFVGAYVGLGTEKQEFYYFNKDTLFNYSHSGSRKSQYFEGGLYRQKGEKFRFSANYLIYLAGDKQGDFSMFGTISQKFGNGKGQMVLFVRGGQYRETPDYFLNRYYSNHYRWNNHFDPQYKTEAMFGIRFPNYNTQLGTRFNLLKNYIHFNQLALPEQTSNAFSVMDVYLNNRLLFGKFGTITRLNYQISSNERVIPLPDFSGYFAMFFQPDIYFKDTDGRMKFQLGFDVSYWTKFYGSAYSPALALFYNQTENQTGNYPFVGAFWNFEIKRLRFYLRGEHLNYGLSDPNNYMVPYYPTNRLVLRYGLVWTFYD